MTERGAGSDPSKLKTRAVRDGGHWLLDGEKWYAGGANGADFAVVAAITNPRATAQGTTLFLVDCATPGWQVVREIPSMGTRLPGGSCEVRLSGCRVPESAVLGEEGGGLALIHGRLARARLSHCMRWVGVCQRALDLASQRALGRETFGSALAQHPAVQTMLADSAIDLYTSRLMVLHGAWLLENAGERQTEVNTALNMSKVFISEALGRVVDRAMQIHGSLGYCADLPLERYYRDARGARIYDGPSEVLRAAIAFQLLRTVARDKSTRGACGLTLGI
jgi:alkylation response protein AidB-like acyl-CoA dehydrogenase